MHPRCFASSHCFLIALWTSTSRLRTDSVANSRSGASRNQTSVDVVLNLIVVKIASFSALFVGVAATTALPPEAAWFRELNIESGFNLGSHWVPFNLA